MYDKDPVPTLFVKCLMENICNDRSNSVFNRHRPMIFCHVLTTYVFSAVYTSALYGNSRNSGE